MTSTQIDDGDPNTSSAPILPLIKYWSTRTIEGRLLFISDQWFPTLSVFLTIANPEKSSWPLFVQLPLENWDILLLALNRNRNKELH